MSEPHMKPAKLTLHFNDGTTQEIELIKAIELDTSGRQEISFRETPKGWVMAFTKSVKEGKMFGDLMLTAEKHH